MKRSLLAASTAIAASLLVLTPASAQGASPGARGHVIIEGLTLAGTQFGTPSGQPTTVATDPVSAPLTRGDTFTYSTITCASPFPPWNSFGLQFDANYPGLTDPASVRHEFQGTVVAAAPSGDHGVVRGTVTSYLCEGGARTDEIVSRFTAVIRPTSATSVPLTGGGPVPTTGGLSLDGRFHITGGTGRFADLSGNGTLMGQLTCLPQTLQRNAVGSCSQLGAYSEAPFQLKGRFHDPTVSGA